MENTNMRDPGALEKRDIDTKGGNYSECIKGNFNQYNNFVLTRSDYELLEKNTSQKPISSKDLSSDHKYSGSLVTIEGRIDFYNPSELNKHNIIILDISFGEVVQKFKDQDKEGSIRFGIKFGELVLDLINAKMPLKQRGEFPTADKIQVNVSSVGTEIPKWQFKANEASILYGRLIGEKLGTLEIMDYPFKVTVSFKIESNCNFLHITCQDGAWSENDDSKTIETITRGFFKHYVKPKIKYYLSRLELEMESIK